MPTGKHKTKNKQDANMGTKRTENGKHQEKDSKDRK